MTTRSHCGRRAVACTMVAIAAAAVSVNSKPHQCFTQDDYARAVLAQYFPAAASSKMMELTPTELSKPASYRASRSDDHRAGAQTSSVIANSPPPVDHGHLGGLQLQHNAADVQTAVADRSRGNDTSSAVTVEKLAAFYEQLKSQQEALARQQFQQQLYEQQQRRQQEFSLVQQQIQQQYYQQQQHALLMLDQMRRNPAFVGQLAAFVDHNSTFIPHNGTSAEQRVATSPLAAVPEVAARGGVKKPQPLTPPKDQTIANHMDVERDDDVADADDFAVKRVDARQVARPNVASSSNVRHRPVMKYDDDDEDDNGGY